MDIDTAHPGIYAYFEFAPPQPDITRGLRLPVASPESPATAVNPLGPRNVNPGPGVSPRVPDRARRYLLSSAASVQWARTPAWPYCCCRALM